MKALAKKKSNNSISRVSITILVTTVDPQSIYIDLIYTFTNILLYTLNLYKNYVIVAFIIPDYFADHLWLTVKTYALHVY